MDRAGTNSRPRALTMQNWGSDADLAGELCMRMAPDLEKLEQQQSGSTRPRPAPIALPSASHSKAVTPSITHSKWDFQSGTDGRNANDALGLGGNPELLTPSPGEVEGITPRRTSFFDVGGLLGHDEISPRKRRDPEKTVSDISPIPLSPGMPYASSPTTVALEDGRTRSSAFCSTVGDQHPAENQPAPVIRNFSRPTSPTFYNAQPMTTIPQASELRIDNHGPSTQKNARTLEPSFSSSPSSLRDVGGLLG